MNGTSAVSRYSRRITELLIISNVGWDLSTPLCANPEPIQRLYTVMASLQAGG